MKVLYIFPGARSGEREGVAGEDFSDSQLFGFNYMKGLGIDAKSIGRDAALPAWFLKTPLARFISFKLRHTLLYFKAHRYDVVFGATLLYPALLKWIFGGKAKYVIVNIELSRILRKQENHPVRRLILGSVLKKFSGIVCLANVQKELLVAQYPFLADKVFFVPLGIDTHAFTPIYEKRNETVLSVGQDDGRDYRTLVAAARLLPGTRFEIVCSPRNLAGIDLPDNVHVFHDLPYAELRKKYTTAQMIVIATEDDAATAGADCSGQTVLLDAVAHGLPIVATRKAYLSDYVQEGEEALIVPSGDSSALAEAITRLKGSAILRRHLAERARHHAEQELSTREVAENLSRIFRHIWTS